MSASIPGRREEIKRHFTDISRQKQMIFLMTNVAAAYKRYNGKRKAHCRRRARIRRETEMATARKASAGQKATRRLTALPPTDAGQAQPPRSTDEDRSAPFVGAFPSQAIGHSRIVLADCFDWLGAIPENSLHAIITDPPYGVKEYEAEQMAKRAKGRGGVWRIPPSFDGHQRAPLPRFTALNERERASLHVYFVEWARLATRALRPGGHVFIASNAFLSQFVFSALVEGGLEFRGELIRLVRTLRGGDRPKNAEEEFADVCSLPRGCYEPWGILRKPLPAKMTVGECLRVYETGGLRRTADGRPFADVILSERTPRRERASPTIPASSRNHSCGKWSTRRCPWALV